MDFFSNRLFFGKALLGAIFLSCATSSVSHGQAIFFSNQSATVHLELAYADGTPLAIGSEIRVLTPKNYSPASPPADPLFWTESTTVTNYQSILDNFDVVATFNLNGGTTTTPGRTTNSVSGNGIALPGNPGDPLYLWVFGDALGSASTSQWALFGEYNNSSWKVNSLNQANLFLTSSTLTSDEIFVGMRSMSELGTLQLRLAAVPEPSTYALLFGAGTLGFVLIRRVRQKRAAAAQATATS